MKNFLITVSALNEDFNLEKKAHTIFQAMQKAREDVSLARNVPVETTEVVRAELKSRKDPMLLFENLTGGTHENLH